MAKAIVTFRSDMCKGCGLCIEACPRGLLEMDTSYINTRGVSPARIKDMDACIACGSCAIMCPDAVITVEKE